MSCVTTHPHTTLTHTLTHSHTVVLADSDPPGWAISTSLIKTVTILLIMLPLSLLRNIAMLEKVGVVCYLDNSCLVTKLFSFRRWLCCLLRRLCCSLSSRQQPTTAVCECLVPFISLSICLFYLFCVIIVSLSLLSLSTYLSLDVHVYISLLQSLFSPLLL